MNTIDLFPKNISPKQNLLDQINTQSRRIMSTKKQMETQFSNILLRVSKVIRSSISRAEENANVDTFEEQFSKSNVREYLKSKVPDLPHVVLASVMPQDEAYYDDMDSQIPLIRELAAVGKRMVALENQVVEYNHRYISEIKDSLPPIKGPIAKPATYGELITAPRTIKIDTRILESPVNGSRAASVPDAKKYICPIDQYGLFNLNERAIIKQVRMLLLRKDIAPLKTIYALDQGNFVIVNGDNTAGIYRQWNQGIPSYNIIVNLTPRLNSLWVKTVLELRLKLEDIKRESA